MSEGDIHRAQYLDRMMELMDAMIEELETGAVAGSRCDGEECLQCADSFASLSLEVESQWSQFLDATENERL